MAAPHTRTASQKTARKDEIRRLLARRYTQEQIAAELGVKQQTVAYWAQRIAEEAQEAAADRTAEIRATLDTLAEVECEAWAAWQRSCRPAESTVRERGKGPRGSIARVQRTRTGQAGDPSFLHVILACTHQRRALLGLDAPTKAQQFVMDELRAGLERLRANLPEPLFLQVAGLLAGRTGGGVAATGSEFTPPLA